MGDSLWSRDEQITTLPHTLTLVITIRMTVSSVFNVDESDDNNVVWREWPTDAGALVQSTHFLATATVPSPQPSPAQQQRQSTHSTNHRTNHVLWEEEIPIDDDPTGATVTLLDAEGTGAGKGKAEYQPTCKVRIGVQIFATGSTVLGRAGNAHSSHVMVLSAICTFDGRGANSIGGSPLRYLNSASTCANDALLHMNEIDPKGPFK
jgi:hypothetical protein